MEQNARESNYVSIKTQTISPMNQNFTKLEKKSVVYLLRKICCQHKLLVLLSHIYLHVDQWFGWTSFEQESVDMLLALRCPSNACTTLISDCMLTNDFGWTSFKRHMFYLHNVASQIKLHVVAGRRNMRAVHGNQFLNTPDGR